MLAGMSTDYYTGLERGNLSGVSGSVLDALARPAARRGREDTPVRPRRHRQRRRPTGAQCAGQPRARPAAPLPSAESALVAIRSSSLRVRQIRRFWAAWSPPRTASLPAHSLLSSGRIEPISGSLVVAACERYGRFVKQHVRFCTATDGVRLAYAVHGSGPPLVRVAPWLSHLELDWESPVWRHWLQQLGKRHTLLRYDERGCGLSDTSIGDPSVDVWVGDLETVADTMGLERFALLGVSQGAAIAVAYAAEHPERVSDLDLYGSMRADDGSAVRGRRKTLSSARSARAGRHQIRPSAECSALFSSRTARLSKWPGMRICSGAPRLPQLRPGYSVRVAA
jgi:alpha/beta hydrolase fold